MLDVLWCMEISNDESWESVNQVLQSEYGEVCVLICLLCTCKLAKTWSLHACFLHQKLISTYTETLCLPSLVACSSLHVCTYDNVPCISVSSLKGNKRYNLFSSKHHLGWYIAIYWLVWRISVLYRIGREIPKSLLFFHMISHVIHYMLLLWLRKMYTTGWCVLKKAMTKPRSCMRTTSTAATVSARL